jgi:gluconolactonase
MARTRLPSIIVAAAPLIVAQGLGAQESILAPGATPKMTLEHGAGEGPAWHPHEGLYFSGSGRISRLDPSGKVHVFRDHSGSNGLLFDRDGRLLVCEPGQRRVTRTEHNGSIRVLADRYQGMRFNQPNDITIDSRGRIYFSDPCYGSRDRMEMLDQAGRKVEGVYRIDPDGNVTRIITHEVDRPNGLVVSADDRYLYVADNNNNTVGGARILWRFDLAEDGSVVLSSQRRLFDWQTGRGPDGMVLDQKGRLFVAAGINEPNPPFETADQYKGGVYVLAPEGELLEFIPILRDEVTNCTFGGEDLKTLYVTAGGTLWSVRVSTAGWLHWPAAQ